MAAGAIIAGAAAGAKRREDEKAALEASAPVWRDFASRHGLAFEERAAEGRRAALIGWLGHNLEAFRYERGRITLVWLGVTTTADVLEMALETLAHAATFRFVEGEASYRG